MGFFKHLKENYLDQRTEFRSFTQPRKYVHLFTALGIVAGAAAGGFAGIAATVAFYSATHVFGLAALAGSGWAYGSFKGKTPDDKLKGAMAGPLLPLLVPMVAGAKIVGAAGRVLDALASLTFLEINKIVDEGRPVNPGTVTQTASPPAPALTDKAIAADFRRSSEMSPDAPVPKREYAPLLHITM